MILCGTTLRPPLDLGPTPVVRLASECGAAGLAIDGDCWTSLIPVLAAEGGKAGVPLTALHGPMAEGRLPVGKRLPVLSSFLDKEERLAAINLTRTVMQLGQSAGARFVTLDLGLVDLTADRDLIRRAFARRELDDDDAAGRAFARALAERRSLGDAILDACRAALDRLVRYAEHIGVSLALNVATDPWAAPTPREATLLMQEFRGGPLGIVWSPARLDVLAAWGLGVSTVRLDELRAHAAVKEAKDAVGLQHDLLPGLGETDLKLLATTSPYQMEMGPHPADHPSPYRSPQQDIPVVLGGRPDSTDAEVRLARAAVNRLVYQT